MRGIHSDVRGPTFYFAFDVCMLEDETSSLPGSARPVTSSTLIAWLEFFPCLAVIGYAGSKLSRYGDIIADMTRLGDAWIGLILMASVTSLPELVTGVSAVSLADAPNIAVGVVLGRCVFSPALIMLLDYLRRKERLFKSVGRISLFLLMIYLLNSFFLYLYSE